MKIFPFLERMDSNILDVLETYCHKQQRLFGTSHFVWLKIDCLIIALLSFFMVRDSHGLSFLAGAIVLIAALGGFFFGLDWWEEQCLEKSVKGFKNPLRIIESAIFIRLVGYWKIVSMLILALIFIVGLGFIGILLATTLIGLVVVLFAPIILIVCDPLPPTHGRLWEQLQNLLRPKATVAA